MSDWPVGISTGCFYQTSIFDCLEDIRRGGFCMIEICSFPAHLDYHDHDAVRRAGDRIEALGMEAYSFHAPFADDIDITATDEKGRNHARHEIMQAAEAAAILEVRHFVIHPGPERSFHTGPAERMERMERAATLLNDVSIRCHELGIGFVLENMLPHLFFGNARDMLWIMGAIDQVNVGTCLDTGHAFLSGDLRRVLYKLSGHLQMIHANDNNGEGDDHLAPGLGQVDWERLLEELMATQFDGGIILELAGSEDQSPEDILARARQGRRTLRQISQRHDLRKAPTERGKP